MLKLRAVAVRRANGSSLSIEQFDLVRLFGAILVIFGHSYPLTGVAGPGLAANGVATIGVKIFFVVSGYLIAQSWLRDPNLPRFLIRRCLRIFPALIVLIFVTTFIVGPLLSRLPASEYFTHPETYNYLQNILLYINYFLPGVFEKNIYPNAVNGSLWSLPAEFSMYILTPFLIAGATVRWARAVFAAVALVFIGASFWLTAVLAPPK
jgi:peptidoglycan/LPS O-acetylase OafA/YrhL